MHIEVLTIFPELFEPFFSTSLIGRAVGDGLLKVGVHDLRSFTEDRHRSVDDEPYGGGGGMVMTAPPWIQGTRELAEGFEGQAPWRVLMSPQGRRLNEQKVRELSRRQNLLLLCPRYEGPDERVLDAVVDEEISIGDFVLSGGELPAMVLIEAVSRQIPGVVGLGDSVKRDSFRNGLLDFPHFTRPRVVEDMEVPEVLLSGNHAHIEAWRRKKSLETTLLKRPDLLAEADLSDDERRALSVMAERLGVDYPAGLQHHE